MTVAGSVIPLGLAARNDSADRVPQLAVSGSGTVIYVPPNDLTHGQSLMWVDIAGEMNILAAPPRRYSSPQLSPDGRLIAVETQSDQDRRIEVYDPAREVLTRLTQEGNKRVPVWSPDGTRVAFMSGRGDDSAIYWKSIDGSDAEEVLVQQDGVEMPGSWSPDGTLFAYTVQADVHDIWILSVEESVAEPFLTSATSSQWGPMFSPDGRWIAYVSNESGPLEVHLRQYPSGPRLQVSDEGGWSPMWAPDGETLFYVTPDGIEFVSVATEPELSVGSPTVLFERGAIQPVTAGGGMSVPFGIASPNRGTSFDVEPDSRLLMVRQDSDPGEATTLNVVLNWFQELTERVPIN